MDMNKPKNAYRGLLLALICLLMTGLSQATEIVGTTYYHHDTLGSPIAATDASGNLLWRESYYPYGERIQNDPNASTNARWFTAHPQDAESGLIYMGARYYDPKIGRFLAIDPVGYQEDNLHSFNRYAYANNNPSKYVDPDGELPILPVIYFLVKEAVSEIFERTTGIPTGLKGLGKKAAKSLSKKGATATKSTPNITKAYKRPSGATTSAQRQSVQGKPCVDCGAKTSKQFADHKDPLVKEYYRTGGIDKTRMRGVGSVQPQCPTCSSRQGAGLSRFSRRMKKEHGL